MFHRDRKGSVALTAVTIGNLLRRETFLRRTSSGVEWKKVAWVAMLVALNFGLSWR